MTPDLVNSREAVKRAAGATRVLMALTVAALATLGVLLADLTARQSALQDGAREETLFAAYRLDAGARSVLDALRDAEAADVPDAASLAEAAAAADGLMRDLRSFLSSGDEALLRSGGAFGERLAAIASLAEELSSSFAEAPQGAGAEGARLARAAPRAAALLSETGALLAETQARVAALNARGRESVNELQGLSVMVLAVLALITGLLLFNLTRQVRTMRKAAAVLESSAQALTAACEAAEAGNRAKSEFMATIGHEIRTPLNAILGMAELLAHRPLGPEERRHVDVITSSGTALLEMLNEILDFAKIEHGRMSSEAVAFDLRLLATEAVRIVEGPARERGNRLSLMMEELPQPAWYRADPALIRRVLLNLLSNAVKFTEQGDVTVRVGEAQGGEGLRFEISDTGIGIPEEARQRLFNAFSQVDSSIGRRFGGSGLGLVICKRIVEMLGGSIGFDSAPGQGSLFWFEVPAPRAEPVRAPDEQPSDAIRDLPALRVLVVEDHPVNRQVAEKFLAMLGQSVTLAKDGAEGVARAAETPFDLILMDMHMPVMDGIAAARAIRATGSTVKIVAMTANASDDDRRLCAEAGMDGFEAKPVTLGRLGALIAHVGSGLTVPLARATVQRPAAIWDGERLDELLSAVGEEGLRDLLRLFQADVPSLLSELSRAVTACDTVAVDRALHGLKGAAANLGLTSIASLAENLRHAGVDHAIPERVAAEIARVRALPEIKKAA